MNGPPPRAHGAGESRAPAAPHPPMADIVASAAQKVESLSRHSIRHLLEQGRMHFSTASAMLASRAPVAGAYWEYLVAYQIVVDLIPRHPDYYDRVDTSRSQTHRDFKLLVQDIKASEERFVRIKDIIKNDNKRNATAPRSPPRPETRSPSTLARRSDELMLPAMPATLPNGNLVAAPRKPPVQPKPQSLHGRAIHASLPSVNGINDLAQRFANLRGAPPPVESTSSPSTRSDQDPAFKMPVPADYASSMRPLGPRDMPLPPLHMPPYPSMLPLNTQFAASLPKEPSPTYSPARNISGPLSINPPRSTPRSMVGTGGRSNSLATSSSISSHAPNGNGTSDSYFPAQNGSRDAPARKPSVSKSVELEIDASKLYDFFRMFNVLLIDVRDRIDFDSGHIYVRNIMCIEPLSLRDGDSAEQLLDRLVLSPDEEQSMFDRRNEYDVVVYYDDSTPNAEFLHKHDRTETQLALKRLFDTLHEFNAEKPLKRPPVFLMGGLDAWVDLVGSQALRVSKTAGMAPGDDQRRPRTTRPSPAVSRAERSNLLKRRRREYVPMDPEEEQKWLEEARKGRMAVDLPAREENDDDELESPFYRSTEEFLRRYPEVEAEQSMMYPSTKFQSTNQYIAPAIPITPSRPPPAVPRVSYSGVHERQVSQQSRAQQASAHLSHSRYINVKLHKTGLLNFGVTCYMNSVVQCLSGSLSLSDLFLTQRYQRDLQRDNWKGTKGILPEAYATLLSNLYKGDVSCVRPSTFRRICGHFNSQWGVDQQQDAKEFLEFVLDYMHEDLNITWNKAPLKPLTDQQELQREQFPRQYAAKIEWGRYQHRDMSVIGGMFAGQHASQLTCQTCGVTSTTYEAFWSISVEIPRDGQCDVRDCLRSYCAPERLAGDEVWRCPRCKKDREAVKKITITRAPDTLVLHFKRFSASRTESARKVRTPVHFPLQGLDMAPFVEPPMTPAQEAYIAQNARDGPVQLASVKADPTMNGPYVYNAYAVIWHIGATLGSGHYIAFVKDKSRGSWRSFNDDKINEFDPGNLPPTGRLQNEKAYIVFYEREQVAGGASF